MNIIVDFLRKFFTEKLGILWYSQSLITLCIGYFLINQDFLHTYVHARMLLCIQYTKKFKKLLLFQYGVCIIFRSRLINFVQNVLSNLLAFLEIIFQSKK